MRDAFAGEFFIARSGRGKGLDSAVLLALPGWRLHAPHLEVQHHNTRTQQRYGKAGFDPQSRYMLVSRQLGSPG